MDGRLPIRVRAPVSWRTLLRFWSACRPEAGCLSRPAPGLGTASATDAATQLHSTSPTHQRTPQGGGANRRCETARGFGNGCAANLSRDWTAELDDDCDVAAFTSQFLYEIQRICQITGCDTVPILRTLLITRSYLGNVAYDYSECELAIGR